MLEEIDVYGVFVPALLVWMGCAFAISACARRILAAAGLYRRLWRPPLFDLGLFITILCSIVFLAPGVSP